MRIAMWSGPRNLSTAMMYAFGARSDCAVSDEPFYAAYLAAIGIAHPMRTEILDSQPTDPAAVIAACVGPVPGGKPHWYQKHMAHHMLPSVPRDWLSEMTNVYLIRHPARVIASYVKKRERPTLDDLGFRQLAELHAQAPGPVIDSADIRANPARALARLCAEIGLPYEASMLTWPAGGHPDDGVWAVHWYGAVHRSTGFDGPEGALPVLDGDYADMAARALEYYRPMREKALN